MFYRLVQLGNTVIVARMWHWKWRETKQQLSRARSGHQIGCCLVSLHFLCDILATITVQEYYICCLRDVCQKKEKDICQTAYKILQFPE